MISKLKAGVNKRVGGAVNKLAGGKRREDDDGNKFVDDVFAIGENSDEDEDGPISQPMFAPFVDPILVAVDPSVQASSVARNCGAPVSAELIGLFVCDFHPTEGPIIEWSYPQTFQVGTRGGLSFPNVDPWATSENCVESDTVDDVVPYVAFLALPDMAHLVSGQNMSYVYFVLPSKHGLVYGVSIYGSVKDSSMKRGHVQKAICALSRAPFFGHLRIRLMPMAKAFFDQHFSRDVLAEWWDSLRLSLHNLQETELFEDLTPAFILLVKGLSRSKLMQLVRAIVLESRIVVYSASSAVCSSVVLCLLSLLPGQSWLGYNSNGFGRRHYHYRTHSFPLRIFHPRCPVYPYVSLEMLDDLIKMHGFLIGTTNKLLITSVAQGNPIDPAIILTLPDDFEPQAVTLTILQKDIASIAHSTSSEKKVVKTIKGNVENLECAQRNEEESVMQLEDPVELVLDAEVAQSRKQYEEIEVGTASLNMVSDVRQAFWSYAEQWTRALAYWSGEKRHLKACEGDKSARICRKQLSKYGTEFLLAWTQTVSGKVFMESHQHAMYVAPSPPPKSGHGEHSLTNGDSYVGSFERSRRHGEGTYTSPSKGLRYQGVWHNDKRHGQGILTIEDKHGHIILCYDGWWVADRRHGDGMFYESCHKHEKYSGQWNKDQYHGRGSHVTKEGVVYDGEWHYGVYHGVGKLKYPNGDSYTGEFEDGNYHGNGVIRWEDDDRQFYTGSFHRGEMHGKGHLACQNQEYDGSWHYGRRHGHGILMVGNASAEGPWFNDKPGPGQFLIQYQQGATYTGPISLDTKRVPSSIRCDNVFLMPHGYGFYKSLTEHFEGQFEYGTRQGAGKLILFKDDGICERYNGLFAHGEFVESCSACEQGIVSASTHTCGLQRISCLPHAQYLVPSSGASRHKSKQKKLKQFFAYPKKKKKEGKEGRHKLEDFSCLPRIQRPQGPAHSHHSIVVREISSLPASQPVSSQSSSSSSTPSESDASRTLADRQRIAAGIDANASSRSSADAVGAPLDTSQQSDRSAKKPLRASSASGAAAAVPGKPDAIVESPIQMLRLGSSAAQPLHWSTDTDADAPPPSSAGPPDVRLSEHSTDRQVRRSEETDVSAPAPAAAGALVDDPTFRPTAGLERAYSARSSRTAESPGASVTLAAELLGLPVGSLAATDASARLFLTAGSPGADGTLTAEPLWLPVDSLAATDASARSPLAAESPGAAGTLAAELLRLPVDSLAATDASARSPRTAESLGEAGALTAEPLGFPTASFAATASSARSPRTAESPGAAGALTAESLGFPADSLAAANASAPSPASLVSGKSDEADVKTRSGTREHAEHGADAPILAGSDIGIATPADTPAKESGCIANSPVSLVADARAGSSINSDNSSIEEQ